MKGRLNYPPGKQATFLPIRREPGAKQLQHILSAEFLHFFDGLAFNLLHEHRSRRLANAASFAIEPRFLHPAVRTDAHFHMDHIAAERIVILVHVGRMFARTAVIRILVMVENVFLVNFFFVAHGHSCMSKGKEIPSSCSLRGDAIGGNSPSGAPFLSNLQCESQAVRVILTLLAMAFPGLLFAEEARTPKVLILGIDGCRTDALRAAEAPNLHRLMAEGAVSENNDVLGERSTGADTVSGPGWSSILTGVWADKHGVLDNQFRTPKFEAYPDMLRRIKQVRPEAHTAALVTWKPLADYVMTEAAGCRLVLNGDQEGYVPGDRLVTAAAVELLSNQNPDLLFAYLGQVDMAGHGHGFHPDVPQYRDALAQVDRHVGEILEAIKKRPNAAKEDWLVIVCTDHGGRGKGHGGGHTQPEVRTTFLIFHGPAVQPGTLEKTANVDVVATALAHLRISPVPEWKLDGRPVALVSK